MDASNVKECHLPSSGDAVGLIDALLRGQLKAEEGKEYSLAARRNISLPIMQGRAMPVCSCFQEV